VKYTIRTDDDYKGRQIATVAVNDEVVAIMGTQEQATEWVAKEVKRRAFVLNNYEVES